MDAAEVAAIITEEGQVTVPYFDGALVTVYVPDPVDTDLAVHALQEFLQLTPEDRRSHGRFADAAMRSAIWTSGPEVLHGLEPPAVETIWDHFTLEPSLSIYELVPPFSAAAPDGGVTIIVGGSVPWDPDHGLYLAFANGSTLSTVGTHDEVLESPAPDHENCVHCGYYTDAEFCITI